VDGQDSIVAAEAATRRTRGVTERLKDALRPLKSYLPARGPSLSWHHPFRLLEHYGLRPKTVFDIGVGFGTHELYRAFPDACFHLFDPTPESLPFMQKAARWMRAEIHPVALGDRDGEVRLEIRADVQGSTLLEEVGPRRALRVERVRMRRFDSLIGAFERPALCKIDVQGAELMVLDGMAGRIDDIDALIVETSTIATVRGGAEIHDVVHLLRGHGLVLADIVGLKRRPLDGATAQLDLFFLPEGSVLRADRRWAATA
jgi:FkbM family methyltransferase